MPSATATIEVDGARQCVIARILDEPVPGAEVPGREGLGGAEHVDLIEAVQLARAGLLQNVLGEPVSS